MSEQREKFEKWFNESKAPYPLRDKEVSWLAWQAASQPQPEREKHVMNTWLTQEELDAGDRLLDKWAEQSQSAGACEGLADKIAELMSLAVINAGLANGITSGSIGIGEYKKQASDMLAAYEKDTK